MATCWASQNIYCSTKYLTQNCQKVSADTIVNSASWTKCIYHYKQSRALGILLNVKMWLRDMEWKWLRNSDTMHWLRIMADDLWRIYVLLRCLNWQLYSMRDKPCFSWLSEWPPSNFSLTHNAVDTNNGCLRTVLGGSEKWFDCKVVWNW